MMHVIAAKAVAFREAQSPEFKLYSRAVIDNAKRLGDGLQSSGYKLVSGGTDSHLLLVDLTDKGMTGKEAEEALDACGITVNKNTVPFEKRSPFVTSGIRLGSAALTTRGMALGQMEQIAGMIDQVLSNIGNESVYAETRKKVSRICSDFPLYADLVD